MMNDDQIGQAIEEAVSDVRDSRAMNPAYATQANSVEFLDGVIEELTTDRDQIKREMRD
jgi:hypothetical protein